MISIEKKYLATKESK